VSQSRNAAAAATWSCTLLACGREAGRPSRRPRGLRREVQVANPDLGQLAPAHPAFDVGLDEQLRVDLWQAWYSRSNWAAAMMRRGFSGRAVSSPRDWGEW
jgi:hypothetical protein